MLSVTFVFTLIFVKACHMTAQCHFPFIFESKAFSSCTTEGRSDGKLWCSTTPNYDSDRQWMFCMEADVKKMNVQCHFPFVYNSKEWTTCTTEGRSDGKLWCSTTPNFDHDGQWNFCKRPASAPHGNSNLSLVLSVCLGFALLCVCIVGICLKVQWRGITNGLWLSSRRGNGAFDKGKDVEDVNSIPETVYENIEFKDF